MARKAIQKSPSSLSNFRDGRDANNLAEWPLALLTDTAPEGVKTIEFEDTLDDWQSGKTLTRRVCITGSDKYGLPTAKDEEVLLALLQLTKLANDFQSPEVEFNKHEIIELLGWPKDGWAFQRVEESLNRWKGTSIYFFNSWRDHRNKKWKNSTALGVLEFVEFSDTRVADETGDARSRFTWNKAFFESFQSGYLRKLDFAVFRSLSRPAAKRAFRFLGKRFHLSPQWEFDLQTFACEKLGFSREYDTGQLKERLRPALGELESIGFIKPPEYHKTRPKHWTIKLEQGKAAKKLERESTAIPDGLVADLVSRGIAPESAEMLASEFPTELIRNQLTAFDELVAKGDKRVAKNPPGFLVSSIRRGFLWNAPMKTKRTRSPAPAPAAVPPTDSPVDPITLQIRQQLADLSSEERDRLEAEAVAQAGKVTADSYRRLRVKGGPLLESLRDQLLMTHLRKLYESERTGSQAL